MEDLLSVILIILFLLTGFLFGVVVKEWIEYD